MDDITHLNKSSSLSKSIRIKFVLKIVKPTKKSNVSRFDNTLKHYIKRSLLFFLYQIVRSNMRQLTNLNTLGLTVSNITQI